jgi:hypothetical protein
MGRTTLVAVVSALGLVAGSGSGQADTLVLRDGRRLEGDLRSIRNGVVEFEEDRGGRGSRIVRFDRDEVRRIEFDDGTSGSDDESDDETDRNGLRERDLSVPAQEPWTDTRIDVRAGQVVYFEATGRVTWGPGRRDGPAGEGRSPVNAGRPIPGRSAAALIGRIGDDSTDYFFIGAGTGPFRMREGGRLYLGINDDYLADNSGSFRVTVRY